MTKTNVKINIFLLVILINVHSLSAQQIQENNYGINGGVIIAIGNKFDRIGININAYYLKNNIQVNPELRVYFNFKNLGPKKRYMEAVTSLGIVYTYGHQNLSDTNYFFSSVSNQSHRKNSIGYSYNYYFNGIGTSQQTGIVSFQFNNFNFIAENDIFARPKLDRFRTGAFLLQYRNKNTQFGINSTLFTGQMGSKITDENYPYSQRYKTTDGGKYAKFSHGLLSGQFQYVNSHYQKTQASIGVDSEKVRHLIQNRLIHDQIFLPKSWRKKNTAHIPMFDEKGDQYLFKENQKIRPPTFYYNFFANPGIFY